MLMATLATDALDTLLIVALTVALGLAPLGATALHLVLTSPGPRG